MNMKRRVVYIEDETWETIREKAEGQKITMSEVIRRALLPSIAPTTFGQQESVRTGIDPALAKRIDAAAEAAVPAWTWTAPAESVVAITKPTVAKTAQARRDEVLRGITKTKK